MKSFQGDMLIPAFDYIKNRISKFLMRKYVPCMHLKSGTIITYKPNDATGHIALPYYLLAHAKNRMFVSPNDHSSELGKWYCAVRRVHGIKTVRGPYLQEFYKHN